MCPIKAANILTWTEYDQIRAVCVENEGVTTEKLVEILGLRFTEMQNAPTAKQENIRFWCELYRSVQIPATTIPIPEDIINEIKALLSAKFSKEEIVQKITSSRPAAGLQEKMEDWLATIEHDKMDEDVATAECDMDEDSDDGVSPGSSVSHQPTTRLPVCTCIMLIALCPSFLPLCQIGKTSDTNSNITIPLSSLPRFEQATEVCTYTW